MLDQVGAAALDAVRVLLLERRVERLAGNDVAHAAVHLERPDRGHDHGRRRSQAGQAALDVDELLEAHVRAEARFGHDRVDELERDAVGHDR